MGRRLHCRKPQETRAVTPRPKRTARPVQYTYLEDHEVNSQSLRLLHLGGEVTHTTTCLHTRFELKLLLQLLQDSLHTSTHACIHTVTPSMVCIRSVVM